MDHARGAFPLYSREPISGIDGPRRVNHAEHGLPELHPKSKPTSWGEVSSKEFTECILAMGLKD